MHDPSPAHDASQEIGDEGLARRVRILEGALALERTLRRRQQAQLDAYRNKQTATVLRGAGTANDADDTTRPLARGSSGASSSPQLRAAPLVQNEGVGERPLALPAGFELNEYRIDSVLGQGGFGITYLATDVNLNVDVAIKEYLPAGIAYRAADQSVSLRWSEDLEFYQAGLDSFLVEARTLATFRHASIVRVARFFEAHRTAYMVLDYERGESLKTWWSPVGRLPERELLVLLKPLLDGLAVVHQAGYLHRDIKPDNIYVRHEDGSLVLLDFGAARQTLGAQQNAAAVVTPGYAPVEQYTGESQGPWTDIYALGATLYWMVSGRKPVVSVERMDDVLPMMSAEELAVGRYSAEFLRAIDWALQVDAKDRPQDVGAFVRALFGAHMSELDLQEALRAGESAGVVTEGWRALLKSPRLARNHLRRVGKKMIRPASWRLDVKLMVAMVCAALLPMFITACYNLYGALASVSDNELQQLEQLAQSGAGRIEQLTNDSRNLAYFLGTDKDFVDLLRRPTEPAKEVILAKLQNLARSNRDVDPLIVMDRDGTAIVSNDPVVVGRNFAFREYFKEAMAGRPHMTGIIVGAARGVAGVYYSHPVRDPQGAVIGVVVLRIQASSIAAILEELKQDELTPFMVDGDGILIYYPDQSKLYHSLEPLPPETLERIAAEQRFRRERIDSLDMIDLARAMRGASTSGHISYTSSISDQPEVAGYAPVRGSAWTVGVTEPRESFKQPLDQLFTNVLYSLVLVGVVFVVLAILLARSIVRPIERLTQAANALKNGDYARANISVTADDEIGRLARTFNIMIDVLRQRDREGRRQSVARHADPLGLDDLGQ